MRIQVLSDLHLEMGRQSSELYHYTIPVNADHLALLGDIGCTIDDRLFDWLREQLKLFKVVFFLVGNHEPYRSSLPECISRLDAFAQEVDGDETLGDFIYLNCTRYDISPTLTILGCTLWSSLNPAHLDVLSRSLMDFRRISEFNPATYNALHRKDLEWLNTTIAAIAKDKPDRKVVIFTHHAPTVEGTSDPQYIGHPTNSAFSTELTGELCWTSRSVKVWASGHTHWYYDFERNGVRVLSNPRGYKEGEGMYDSGKVIEL